MALLRSVSCTVPTIRGPVVVSHHRLEAEHRTDLHSPLGTTAIVGVPARSLEGVPVIEVAVNGIVVWETGVPVKIPGVEFVGSSSEYLTFEVAPGKWSFVARSRSSHLFSDGPESGDVPAW